MRRFRMILRRPLLALLLVIGSLLATGLVGSMSARELVEQSAGDDDEDRDLDPNEEGSSGEAAKAREQSTPQRGVALSVTHVRVDRTRSGGRLSAPPPGRLLPHQPPPLPRLLI
jgi:hypothetical protein